MELIHLLERKLIEAARRDKPSEAVPYAFEKRVLAQILGRPAADSLTLWSQALWRAVAPCAAIALFLGAWTFFLPEPSGQPEEFAQQFESTILAGSDQNFD